MTDDRAGRVSAAPKIAPKIAQVLAQLTALRFLAAGAVMLSHLVMFETSADPALRRFYDGFLHEGYCGVSFFYILSGFIIAHAYSERLRAGSIARGEYLWLRLIRIAPLHWLMAAAVATWLVAFRHEPPAPATLLANLLLVHAWFPQSMVHYSLNGPSWSLSCELFFYVMFPVLIAWRARSLAIVAGASGGAILLAAIVVAVRHPGWSPVFEWLFYVNPATRLLDFMVGILLHHGFRRGLGRRLATTPVEVALLGLVPAAMMLFPAIGLPLPLRWQLAWLPLFAAITLIFAHGGGGVSRLLQAAPLVLLGDASFVLYLTHRPIFTLVDKVAGRFVPPGHEIALAALLLAGCTALSVVLYRVLDAPLNRRLHALVRRRYAGRMARGGRGARAGIAGAAGLGALALSLGYGLAAGGRPSLAAAPVAVPRTSIGINLSGLAPYNRQQVFTNLIAQSAWFSDSGHGWTMLGPGQLDRAGWVRFLNAGQVAPRPLVLPDAPFGRVAVRCTFAGSGALSAGGIAHVTASEPHALDLDLISEGGADEGAWIQLDRTDPRDPLRDIDCRDRTRPAGELYHPAFIASLRGFAAVRFLDWQATNLNRPARWDGRTPADAASQVGQDGVAIEHMVRLANEAGVDPWFPMPYDADAAYVAGFARYVHDHLAPARTVYVELGNEVWNDMFAATMQARREGLALGLAPADDPVRAQTLRYAQKSRAALRIWTAAFADRPGRLVRVVATLNLRPDLARMILGYQDMPRWIDALATAPYIHLDLAGYGAGDADRIFPKLDAAVDETIGHAAEQKAIAANYGKRYIAYEGGQHLVTPDMALARRIQRDPRMAEVYRRYLTAWRTRIGDRLMLYASTAPIGEAGAWGLREYAGQPRSETPKLRAVEAFIAGLR